MALWEKVIAPKPGWAKLSSNNQAFAATGNESVTAPKRIFDPLMFAELLSFSHTGGFF